MIRHVVRFGLAGLLATGLGTTSLWAQAEAPPVDAAAPLAETPIADAEAPAPPVDAPAEAPVEQFELKFQQGVVELPGGLATLTLPPQLRYLDPQQTQFVLEEMWGNPPDADVLGMIFPADIGPEEDASWGVVISYNSDGHVDDADAASIDYDDLLRTMQAGTSQANAERKAQGYETVELVGWAEPPRYDAATKKLYWAKNLRFEEQDENTLNYSVRVLGRHGYLELNAVASMGQLPVINENMPQVISAVEFKEGSRYADFNPATDRMAEYGIAALIAGGVAAKTGLLKGLFVALLAAKKFVVIAVVAIFAFLAKLLGMRKKEA
jgi:uncharacterized membrane-anchored protein